MKLIPQAQVSTAIPTFARVGLRQTSSRPPAAICLVVFSLFFLLVFGRSVKAQSYGPPAFLMSGSGLYIYNSDQSITDESGNSYQGDIYYKSGDGNSLAMVDNSGRVWNIYYDGTGYQFNSNCTYSSGLFSNSLYAAVGSDLMSFQGLPPGVTLLSNYNPDPLYNGSQPYYVQAYEFVNPNNGVFVSFYEGMPASIFIIDASPYYFFDGTDSLTLDESSGTWPASNIVASSPPSLVYINSADPALLSGTSSSWDGTTYNINYSYPNTENSGFPNTTITWSYSGGAATASISGYVDVNSTATYFYLNLDPDNWQILSGGSAPSVAVSFSGPSGTAAVNGPSVVSWNDNLLQFYYTTSDGKNLYWSPDNGDGTGDYTVIVASDNSVVAVHANINTTGTYSSTPGSFTFSDTADTSDLLALDQNGNPYNGELPTGLTMIFGAPAIGSSIELSNNQQAIQATPNYTYRRPDGSYGVLYTGLPANYYFLIVDTPGNYDSQIYVTNDTSTQNQCINGAAGWPQSNAYPSQLYVNGVACALQWSSNYVGGPGYTNGGASYASSGGSTSLSLNWTWNSGSVTWTWSMGSGQWSSASGSWDGVSTFSGAPAGLVISLNPPRATPETGPANIAWNGSTLNFNSVVSGALGQDVYDGLYNGNPIRVAIDAGGNVAVYLGYGGASGSLNSTSSYTGTYNSHSNLFDFGSSNVGTVASLGNSNTVLGTSSSTGNLDIPGNILSLGTWQNSAGESMNGFSLAFTPPPASGQVALLQFGSTIALTDWLWTRSVTDGSASQQTAMELDPTNKLWLYSSGDTPTAQIALDPTNGASFQVPVRFRAGGDISMGNFTSGPQPGQ